MQITHFVQGVVVVAAVVCIRKVLGLEGEAAMKLCPYEVARHLLSSLVISKAGTDCSKLLKIALIIELSRDY